MKTEDKNLEWAEKQLEDINKLQNSSQFRDAIERININLPTVRKLNNSELLIKYLHSLASNLLISGLYSDASRIIQNALSLSLDRLGEEHKLTAICYLTLGNYFIEIDSINEALLNYKKAYKLMQTHWGEKHLNTLKALSNIGICFKTKGDINTALKNLHSIIQYISPEHDAFKSMVYFNIGNCYAEKGSFQRAIGFHLKSLKIRLDIYGKIHYETASSYNNLGTCYNKINNQQKALNYYTESLNIFSQIFERSHRDIGGSFMNIGLIHEELKNHNKAIFYYKKGLEIQLKSVGEKYSQIALLYSHLGRLYFKTYRIENAIKEYIRSIDLFIKTIGDHSHHVINVYNQLAKIYAYKEEYKTAFNFYLKAITINCNLKHSIKDVYYFHEAKDYLHNYYLFDSYYGLSKNLKILFEKERGTLKFLMSSYNINFLNISFIERQKTSFTLKNDCLHFTKETYKIYSLSIDTCLLIDKYYRENTSEIKHIYNILSNKNSVSILNPTQAKKKSFIYSEKSKNFVLYSNIIQQKAKLFSQITQELQEKEYNLKVELNYLQKQINESKYKQQKNQLEAEQETQILAWESKKFDYQKEYNELIELFEKQYPEYYHAKYNTKIVFDELFEALEPHQSIIEYFISEEHIYLFFLSKDNYEVKQINKPDEFDAILGGFTTTLFNKDLQKFTDTSHQLYTLLFSPIEDLLENTTEIIIIPDGELSYIPFETLLYEKPPRRTKTKDLPYLIKKYAISYHFSATLWHRSVTQENTEQPDSFMGCSPLYAGIAPTDAASTEEAKNLEKNLPLPQAGMRTIFRDGQKMLKLEYAEKEVEEISKMFEAKGLKTQVLQEEKATVSQFITQTPKYKYILVSGHGFYDPKKPELSGIVFTPATPNEEKEKPKNLKDDIDIDFIERYQQDDAILYVADAYILKLDADLVVLSCCESGAGQLVKGEGVLGINRGFLYSGAKNIIYTLFKVPDKASYLLTKYLFEGILAGKSYKIALQEAKIELIKQQGIDPIHWAGYVLIGK